MKANSQLDYHDQLEQIRDKVPKDALRNPSQPESRKTETESETSMGDQEIQVKTALGGTSVKLDEADMKRFIDVTLREKEAQIDKLVAEVGLLKTQRKSVWATIAVSVAGGVMTGIGIMASVKTNNRSGQN